MSIRQVVAGLSFMSLLACQQPLPTAPTNVNVFNQNTQNQGENQNQNNGGQQPQSCDGLAGAVSLAFTGGVFNGGHGKVNEILHLSLNVTATGGGQLPPQCTQNAPTVTVAGACSVPVGVVQSLGDIQVLPNAPGLCVIAASYLGKSTSLTNDITS